jgi:hypothetical protein
MVPPNYDLDGDRRVHHRITSAGDEANFRRLSTMVEALNSAGATALQFGGPDQA